MKTLLKSLALIWLAFSSIMFVSCSKGQQQTNVNFAKRSDVEEVVYMSDIDGLVTAVMLYGITNGITFQGTNYVFVVEPTGALEVEPEPSPEPTPTPVSSRYTTLKFANNPDQSYLIEGELTYATWENLGIMSSEYGPPTFVVQPTEVIIGDGVTSISTYAFMNSSELTSMTISTNVSSITCNGTFDGCNSALFDTTTIPGLKLIDGWVVGSTISSFSGSAFDFTGCRGIATSSLVFSTSTTGLILPPTLKYISQNALSDIFRNITTIYVAVGDTNRMRTLLQNSGFSTSGITFIEQ